MERRARIKNKSNIHAMLGQALNVMKKNPEQKGEIKELKDRVSRARSYEDAIDIIAEYVELRR
jgi:hypothetical protein